MAFVIEIESDGGEPHYWVGGEIFSVYSDEAVRFMGETDAETTIDLFRKKVGISPTARVVDLGKVIDASSIPSEASQLLA